MLAAMRTIPRSWVLAMCCAAVVATAGCSTKQPYIENSAKHGFHLFTHPKKKNPADQLRHAEQLYQEGRIRAARKQYYALMVFWPEATEAARAQHQFAVILDQKGKYLKAFSEYQRLFERYTGLFPYDEVLNRQFEIATNVMARKKGKFLFLPGFAAPERAIPLYESIMTNAPQSERAAEVQYLIGHAYDLSLQYEEAVTAFMIVQQRYPSSPFAEKAGYDAAYCFYRLAQENPNNEQILEGAWTALALFLNTYPESEKAEVVKGYRNTVLRQRAKLAYEKARYYDLIAKKPKAALIAYRALVGQFPHSDWTGLAQIRIDALSKLVPPDPTEDAAPGTEKEDGT